MAKLNWNVAGTRFYEAGVDRGVLQAEGQPSAVVWTGLISVSETPSGAAPQAYYIDGEKYLNLSSTEEFEATIEAYTYPPEFDECDGTSQIRTGLFITQQSRKTFALSYRTKIGNDQDGADHAYKIHIIYNALASPSQRAHGTLDDSVDPINFSWAITTKPPVYPGYRRTAHVIVDSRYTHPVTLEALEDILYGDDDTDATIPTLEELVAVFDIPVEIEVVDNGDGTFTISGPDDAFVMLDGVTVQITGPTVLPVDEDTYTISS